MDNHGIKAGVLTRYDHFPPQAIRKTAFGQVTLFPCYLAAFFTYITMLETGGNFTAATDKLRNGFAQAYAVGESWQCKRQSGDDLRVCPCH